MPGARTKPKTRKKTLPAEKILELGRRHFARDFPNPKRQGCPAANELKLLADNPRKAKESVLNHISTCSPCYRDYSGFLKAKKRKARAKSDGDD